MTDVEQAAFDYAEAVRARTSADECGAPSNVLLMLEHEINRQEENLLRIALQYFDRTHDGAPV